MTTQINTLNNNDWIEEDIFSEKKRKVEYLYFDDDTLALVCSCLRTGKDLAQTFTIVEQVGKKQIDIKGIIKSEDRELADKISIYFQKKFTLRRLKNEYISPWMQKAEAVLQTPKIIREDHIGLLVKLPDFFIENREMETIFKKYKSYPSPKKAVDFDNYISFVESVKRNSKNQKHITYYFSTTEDYLVSVTVPNNNIAIGAWQFIADEIKTVKLKGIMTVSNQAGYDFWLLKLNSNYQIERKQ